jgi:single-strand selective monofunctional uracil DNA glycosylase
VTGKSSQLIAAARELSTEVDRLAFQAPVTHVYHPLDYAWAGHELYLRKFGAGPKRVVFLGMNPGPFGMVQTGIPFGEITAVRHWMGIHAKIKKPAMEHPKRPVTGFDCARSEISGQRLWKLFADRFGPAEKFFADHFVVNYCPLAFCGQTGCNLTPDKLRKTECEKLYAICDRHLHRVLETFKPEWLIGIGDFAAKRGTIVADGLKIKVGRILHPSPASPAANRGWAKLATQQLVELGVW